MGTKIGTVDGYSIEYDRRDRLFHLVNAAGEDVGSGKTQEDVEAEAKKLSKQKWTFPIPVIISYRGPAEFQRGRVTSVDLGHNAVWFVASDGSRSKRYLSGETFYEATTNNQDILPKVAACRQRIKAIEGEIEQLKRGLDCPVDLAYFGLKG